MQSASQWVKDLVERLGELFGLALMIFALGVKRERVNATLERQRDEMRQNFARIDRQLASILRYIAAAHEQRAQMQRWQGRVETALASIERRLDRVEARLFPAQEVAA